MDDVFVSYAHENEAFVASLRSALTRLEREVWVDTEGIEPSDRWKLSAHEAIERSDAFVFVLSPASLGSDPCLGELEHAVSLNKRLIAICVDQRAADVPKPAELAELSWIMMRPGDDFESGIDRLVRALDTDLEIARTHTRILVRAKAWEMAARRSSPLLRGEELSAAEEWLSRAGLGRGPQPTELQREFIAGSRRAATRRQRTIASVSLVVAAVALALGGLAWIKRGEAIANEKLAQSRSLAGQATGILDADPGQGALLALEAYRSAPTFEARSAVITALEHYRDRVLRRDTDSVTGVAINHDGSLVASASLDGSVRVWNYSAGAQVLALRNLGPVRSIAFSGNGQVLAWGGEQDKNGLAQGIIGVHFFSTGRTLIFKGLASNVFSSVALSADGSTLAAGSYDGSVSILDLATGRHRKFNPVGQVLSVALNGAGDLLAVTGAGGAGSPITLWNVADLRRPKAALGPRGGFVYAAAFNSGGSLLATGDTHGVVTLWNTHHHTEVGAQFAGPTTIVHAIAFSRDGAEVASAFGDGTIRLWSVLAHRPVGAPLLGHTGPVLGLAFGPNNELVSSGSDETIREWDQRRLDRERYPVLGRVVPNVGSVNGLSLSADGRILAASRPSAPITFWNAGSLRELGSLAADSTGAKSIALSPDGRLIAAAGGPVVPVWDVASHALLPQRLSTTTGQLYRTNDVAFSSDGTMAVASADNGALLWPVAEHNRALLCGACDPAQTFSTQNTATSVALSPDRSLLALGDDNSGVQLWNVNARKALRPRLMLSTGTVETVALSPDGRRVAAAGQDSMVHLWNVASRRQFGHPLAGHQDTVDAVAFSPDGTALVSASADGTARIWDVATQRQLGQPLALSALAAGVPSALTAAYLDPASAPVTLKISLALDRSGDFAVGEDAGGPPMLFPGALLSRRLSTFERQLCPVAKQTVPAEIRRSVGMCT